MRCFHTLACVWLTAFLRLSISIRRSYIHLCFIRVLHTAPRLRKPNLSYLGMESNSRFGTDMDDQAINIFI
ncbi:hypothetical protein H4582DRAFT_1996366 [Lactarius indigo]|nr:hypothetical protein H4582DRAFT_1996366 [Lactarius indigo]